MSTWSYDPREFESTYFALRLGLMFSALLVLLAPAAVGVVQGDLPPSISDSWYTDARTVFVLGLAAGSALLIVVRGDTLTEQTLLNVAGGLGTLVAAAACWPKDEEGTPLPVYDPEVVVLNEYAIAALLILAFLVWLTATLLPADLVGTGWHVNALPGWLLRAVYPVLVVGAAVMMVRDAQWLATHVHGAAAVAMFALLGAVSLLRTSPGLRLLRRIGDTPVDDSLSMARLVDPDSPGVRARSFDATYAVIAVVTLGVVAVAVALHLNEAAPGWVLFVEATLLVLFLLFWGVQTYEAWGERGRRRRLQPGR